MGRDTVRQAFEQRVDRIETFVRDHGQLFGGLADQQTEVLDRVDNFRYHHERLDKSLVILLLGGTGTGKSTLINALAGREISGSGVKRAYTENYFIYHHRRTPIAFLNPVLGEGDQWIPHDREGLREKVIIDAPDFDSLKELNRDKVLAMLELADLVLTVVTSEKYRDKTLYDILESAKALKRFVFVYNKIDREFSPKVMDQLSSELSALGINAEIYKVSAFNAFQNATDKGQRETGDFDRLVKIIEDELDQAQIKEIKQKNLDGLFGTIRHQVVSAVPKDFGKRVGTFAPKLEQILQQASQVASKRVVEDVFAETDAELSGLLKSIQYYSFGGVFGFYMALVDKLRAMRPGYLSVGNMDQFRMRRMLGGHCDRIERGRLKEAMDVAGEEVGKALRDLGVSEDLATGLREVLDTEGFYAALVDDVTDGLSEQFFGQFERYCMGRGRDAAMMLRNAGFNALPTGFCVFVLINLLYQYFANNAFLGTEYLTSSLVVLLVLCFFVQLAAEKRFARENWGFLSELQGKVSERVVGFLRQRLGGELGGIQREIEAIQQQLEAIQASDAPAGATPSAPSGPEDLPAAKRPAAPRPARPVTSTRTKTGLRASPVTPPRSADPDSDKAE